ncbi:MAG: threonine ammonia-lyase [Nitrososphaerales archaeon]
MQQIGLDFFLEKIHQARKRINGYAFRTPAYKSFSVENTWLKLECYQPVRSFKIRGASNKILSIKENERKERGVITASSGNHGLAVAYVAHKLGIKATIVLPETVIPDKLEMIKSLSVNTVLFGNQQDERSKKADEISKNEGQIIIQPFNDEEIIAGQGTCGLEIIEDVPDLESLFVPIGGGGLISGVASAVKLNKKTSHIKVIGVQPEGSSAMYESWKKGQLSSIAQSKTVADGLSVRRPGEITFSFVKRFVDEIMLVSDDEIMQATYQLLRKEHVLSEPSGAAALAALLKSRKETGTSSRSAVIVSGGNISQEMLSRLLSNFK